MRDLTRRGATATPTYLPDGQAFAIDDLVLVNSWAKQHNFHMALRLDHAAASGADYEEAIVLHPAMRPLNRLIVWRGAAAIFAQPLGGKRRQYASVQAVLESLRPRQGTILTDVVTTGVWPV